MPGPPRTPARRPVLPAPVLVVTAVASVQIGAAVATRLFPAIGPVGTVEIRLAIAALLLLLVARPRIRQARPVDLRLAVAYGAVLAAMNLSFYLSLARVPLGIAVTVEFIGPLGVAVSGSRRRLDLVWVLLAAVGVALLAGDSGGHIDPVGLLLAAVAGACWAAYILLAQRVGRVFPGAAGLTIALVVGALLMAPAGIAAGGRQLLSADVLLRGAAVAVLSSAVPYSLELAALRRLRASVFGVLMSMEPAMAALSGLIFLGQRLGLTEWLAVGCVMAASVGATTGSTAVPAADVPGEPRGMAA